MNFLIDTNICSAYLKGDQIVWNKFMLHSGGLAVSAITAGELWTWVARSRTSEQSRRAVQDFLGSIEILEIDLTIAIRFGELRAMLLDKGTPMPDMDGLIAATALACDLTLVTHNTSDFLSVPNLRIENWLI